ncbi:hypothetical protein, partial [Nocardiopsis ansamitocini]
MTENGGAAHGAPNGEQGYPKEDSGSWFKPSGDRYRTQADYQDPYEDEQQRPDYGSEARDDGTDQSGPAGSSPYPDSGGYPGLGYLGRSATPGMAEPYPSALGDLGAPPGAAEPARPAPQPSSRDDYPFDLPPRGPGAPFSAAPASTGSYPGPEADGQPSMDAGSSGNEASYDLSSASYRPEELYPDAEPGSVQGTTYLFDSEPGRRSEPQESETAHETGSHPGVTFLFDTPDSASGTESGAAAPEYDFDGPRGKPTAYQASDTFSREPDAGSRSGDAAPAFDEAPESRTPSPADVYRIPDTSAGADRPAGAAGYSSGGYSSWSSATGATDRPWATSPDASSSSAGGGQPDQDTDEARPAYGVSGSAAPDPLTDFSRSAYEENDSSGARRDDDYSDSGWQRTADYSFDDEPDTVRRSDERSFASGGDFGGDLGTGSGNTWAFSRDDPRLPDSVREVAEREREERERRRAETADPLTGDDHWSRSEEPETPAATDDPLLAIANEQAQARAREREAEAGVGGFDGDAGTQAMPVIGDASDYDRYEDFSASGGDRGYGDGLGYDDRRDARGADSYDELGFDERRGGRETDASYDSDRYEDFSASGGDRGYGDELGYDDRRDARGADSYDELGFDERRGGRETDASYDSDRYEDFSG